MVQYYHDLWVRRIEMLAPLTSLVGECGQTKVTRAKGTKKGPWHWEEINQRASNRVKATIAKAWLFQTIQRSSIFTLMLQANS
jgi:hypothetical protein